MQPTGRTVPNSIRALIADGDQRNVSLCGRGLEGLQLLRMSLGGHNQAIGKARVISTKIPARLSWAVAQLAPRSRDAVLEIGCGTGVAAELLCARLVEGRLTAIDRSAAMVAATRRRNRSCIAAGRAVVRQLALAEARFSAGSFDRALAVNVNVFWLDPVAELATLRRILRPRGMVCLVYQPPSAGQVSPVAARCSGFLREHGFTRVRVTTTDLRPGIGVSIRAFTRAA